MSYIDKVIEWAKARDFHTVNASDQMLKLREEHGELNASIARKQTEGIKDAIGDMLVVLIIQNWLEEIDCQNLLFNYQKREKAHIHHALSEVDNFMAVLSLSILKHDKKAIHIASDSISQELDLIAGHYNFTLDECLEQAYNEIKDRKGKMIDGVWVKAEDLK